MSVGSVGAVSTPPVMSERMEGPGPDRDGDADDAGAVQAPVQAAPAPGTGQVVDKTA
jgi:hypothetical protein